MAESKASDGISMLAKLAGDIVQTKTTAGSKLSPGLTPVAGEVAKGLPNTPAAFPYDAPNDVIVQSITRIEAEIATLTGVVTALKLLIGVPEVTAAEIAKDKAVTQKLLEREAERRIADQKKAEAGDKRAQERVNVAEANPMAAVVEAAEAKDRKRAAVLAAMMDAGNAPEVTAAVTEAFDHRLARLADEAQDAAFGHQLSETPAQAAAVQNAVTAAPPAKVEPATSGTGWSCPKHGDTMIAVKVSPRRGVQFRKCAVVDCHEFEKV